MELLERLKRLERRIRAVEMTPGAIAAHHVTHELGGSDQVALDASQIATGTVATTRLGSGTANSSTFLRGDQTWGTPAGGSVLSPIYFAPTGALYETCGRDAANSTNSLAPGTLQLAAIALPSGVTVQNLSFYSGSAMSGQSHWWFALFDSGRVMLARTADQLTAAWSTDTVQTLPIAAVAAGAASSFTTTYTGLHYLGIMAAVTTTTPTLSGRAMTTGLNAIAPVLASRHDTGMTTPPAFPFTAGAITTTLSLLPYGYIS